MAASSGDDPRAHLESTEDLFEPLCAEAGLLQFIVDLDQNALVYVSPYSEELWETSREALYQNRMAVTDRIHPDDRDRVLARFERLSGTSTISEAYRVVLPSGRRRWVVCHARRAGNRLVGLIQDISRQRTTEIRLAAKGELTRLLARGEPPARAIPRLLEAIARPLDFALGSVWEVDPTGDALRCIGHWRRPDLDLAYLDEAFPRVRVARGEGVLGRAWASEDTLLVPDLLRDAKTEGTQRVYDAGVRAAGAFPIRHGDAVIGMLAFGGHPGIARDAELREVCKSVALQLGLFLERHRLDAAARREAEQRELLAEQLRQSQKMEAMGRLAGGVAHDFNNLLQVINGYTEMLVEVVAHDELGREAVERMRHAGRRAAGLTRQLLVFSRKQMLELRVADLGELVRDSHRLFLRLIGEDVEVALRPQPGLKPVRVDPGQMDQVLMNLLVNARDAMPSGGRIRIEIVNVEVPPGAPGPVPPGHWVRLSVADTGCGIPRELHSKVFEPFFTTKDRERGTGLGLSTVYGIVKQFDGHVDLESEPGKGTTFHVYLPAVEGRPARATAAATPEVQASGETVLLVEDEVAIRDVITRMLRSAGHRVLVADDGDHALELVQRHPGPVDLAMCDVVMPHRSGPVLAEELRRHRPGLPVLFISGYTEHASLSGRVLAAGSALLQKPFDISQLLDAVQRALSERPKKSPPAAAELRALVVDDVALNRELVCSLLECQQIAAEQAETGEAALALVAERAFDVLLLDLTMPGMNGFEVARRVRQPEPGAPRATSANVALIAVTSNTSPADRVRAREAGFDELVPKPVDPEQLASALRRWVSVTAVDPAPSAEAQRLAALAAELGWPAAMRLAQLFLTDLDSKCGALRTAATRDARDTLLQAAHALRGEAFNLGAARLGALCQELEALAAEGARDAIAATLDRLVEEAQRVHAVVARHLQS